MGLEEVKRSEGESEEREKEVQCNGQADVDKSCPSERRGSGRQRKPSIFFLSPAGGEEMAGIACAVEGSTEGVDTPQREKKSGPANRAKICVLLNFQFWSSHGGTNELKRGNHASTKPSPPA